MVWNPVRAAVKTGPDGRFTLPPLRGKFRIWAPASTDPWFSEAKQHSPSPRLAVLPQEHTFDGTQEPVELEIRASPRIRVGGRVTERDGSPARNVGVYFYCNFARGRTKPFDAAQTDTDGRYAFDGIPAGLQGVMIVIPTLRRSEEGGRTYLRAKPLPHVKGADRNGFVRLERIEGDLTDLDFEFAPWNPRLQRPLQRADAKGQGK